MQIHHIYCTCQPGAEQPLKQEVAVRAPELRFAFSRPGFVTFKLSQPTELRKLQLPRLIFARTYGASLGRLPESDSLSTLSAGVWQLPEVQELLSDESSLRLHVWQRDMAISGEGGFEPFPTPLAIESRTAIFDASPAGALERRDTDLKRPPIALDVALVEPNQWWVGCHAIQTRSGRWPGGVPPLSAPDDMVSRAYLKMKEALAWGQLCMAKGPAAKGDTWIDLGCAPGGATQALLESGMHVIGVDPAEVDPALAEHSRFRHLKMRAGDVRRNQFADARWLTVDINAAPAYTLDAVESVVAHASTAIRGLVLTLKLADWSLAKPEKVLEYFERIRSWGYRDVRARQLAFNRREMCIVALRSRGQRRIKRS